MGLLGAVPTAPLWADQDRAEVESSALYLLGHYGAKFINNADANSYFGNGGFNNQAYQVYGGHLGFQFNRLVALEASVDVGPFRNFNALYTAGPVTGTVQTDWNLLTYSLTPALTWAGTTRHNASYVHFLGLRLGLAALRNNITDTRPGVPGGISNDQQAFDFGVLLRTSFIAADHFSVGVEGGYDWTRFNNATAPGGSNTANLDFSGPHVDVVLGLWSNPPMRATAITPSTTTSKAYETAASDKDAVAEAFDW
jgi:hypothetical protein